MKYIKMQETVKLVSLFGDQFKDENGGDAELTCKQFILQRLLDKKFGTGMDAIMSAFQIKQALEKADDVLELETKDWELLVSVVKTPSPGSEYNTNVAHCLLDFMKAIIGASDSS